MLAAYAGKINSVVVREELFFSFYEENSGRTRRGGRWDDTRKRFLAELDELKAEGKCGVLMNEMGVTLIFLPQVFHDTLLQHYNAVEIADRPFPSEDTLGIRIPEQFYLRLDVETDLSGYFEIPAGGEEPAPISSPLIKIVFPGDFGSAMVPAEVFPRRFIEICLAKVQMYLQSSGNKEYAYQKLIRLFKGKETFLRGTVNALSMKAQECYSAIAEGDELTSAFWTHFCAMVIRDAKDRNVRLSEDITVVQAVYGIDAMNSCCKVTLGIRRQKDQAFKELWARLNEMPYIFSIDDIAQFTDGNGTPLLGIYTRGDLELWLRKQVTEAMEDALPELLLINVEKGGQYIVPKNKLLFVCARLVGETLNKLKGVVFFRWTEIFKKYARESAMDDDRDFERLLIRQLPAVNPLLASMLSDTKLLLVYDEMGASKEFASASSILFDKRRLLPYRTLFLLDRRELVKEVRANLPLRYTIPIISAIIAFFMRRFHGSRKVLEEAEPVQEKAKTENREESLRKMAASIVPQGEDADSYMEKLADRWMPLTNKEARKNTLNDVNSLIRDKLREDLRMKKAGTLDRDEISALALGIIEWNESLRNVSGRTSLKQYIELYIIKLLETATK
ncbi:MAG: hypothetical protein LBR23_02855 [Spirochaetaceae bacterium]|jgi:hypothetical protein|nr:hypothetical protein [Spirochaetaceae bacterium]